MDALEYEAEIKNLKTRNDSLYEEYKWLFKEYQSLKETAKAMVKQVDILMVKINERTKDEPE